MGLLPLPQRIGISAGLDCMQRWFVAIENVGYISENKLASLF